ncbi:translocation protein SEC63 [Nematocida sp. AWRm80]|nr:translocation protein SEC63 [Nematocida sp. AWRm80]
MNKSYEYDSSGVSSSLLGVGLLCPLVIGMYQKAFSQKNLKGFKCKCSNCSKRTEKSRVNIYKIAFFILCLLMIIPLKNVIFREYGRTGIFDPYLILEVGRHATSDEVEDAYRARVRIVKVRERNKKKMKAMVQDIIKAHKILIDPKHRENWDAFGDGDAKESHVIAIPSWIMSKNNSLLVLLLYILLLGVIFPKGVSYIWKYSFNHTSIGVSYNSTEALYHIMKRVKKCNNMYLLVEWMILSSTEIKEYTIKTPAKNIAQLKSILQNDLCLPLSKSLGSKYIIGMSLLGLQNEEVLSRVHQDDITMMQNQFIKLINGIKKISIALRQKSVFYLAIDLQRSIVQAVPDAKYIEMQYPDGSFEDSFVRVFESRKYQESSTKVAETLDKKLFKIKPTAINLYTSIDGPIVKEEFITGTTDFVIRVIMTREGAEAAYRPPTAKKTRKADLDIGDLSVLDQDDSEELNPKELEKHPILIRNSTVLPVHAPFFNGLLPYSWIAIVEINGEIIMESPEFTPGPQDTEVLFKIPPLNNILTDSKKAVIDIRLVCEHFFNRDILLRKTVMIK